MRKMRAAHGRYGGLWLSTLLVPAAAQLALSLLTPDRWVGGSAHGLFWLVVLAAGACVLTSAAVLVRAARRREAELSYIGLFFLTVSCLPFVHGLTTPGVLYGANTATISSVQWSIPVAFITAAPALLPVGLGGRMAHRHWRAWTALGVLTIVGLSGAVLVNTELLPTVGARSGGAVVLGLASVVGCGLLSRRHLYLARVADSRMPLLISLGYGFVGSSALVWFGAEPFSAGFWFAHGLDISGVFVGTVGALVTLRSTARVRAAIEPVLTTDPLAALELGIDPVVHRFIADLEAKDPVTRDHVIRTAETAMAIGAAMGLHGTELRHLGLTGLLHDIGKLDIPDAILNKPGRLDPDEYEIMKRHTAFGQAMVETSPALAAIGPYVRAHHERIDGGGYPDGRGGQAIPLISRIVAVSDSFDAMANTRQYREGMGTERALAILQEHAGSQWDRAVVDAAVAVIGSRRTEPSKAPTLDAIGRQEPERTARVTVGCDCIPEALRSPTSGLVVHRD